MDRIKSSSWFEIALVLAGIIVGSFSQGLADNARHQSIDVRLTALAVADTENYQALQASFRRREQDRKEEIEYITVAVNEVLQRLARMEGPR